MFGHQVYRRMDYAHYNREGVHSLWLKPTIFGCVLAECLPVSVGCLCSIANAKFSEKISHVILNSEHTYL